MQYIQFIREVRVYGCVRGMIRDKTGLDRSAGARKRKALYAGLRSGLDSAGSRNHWCIFNKVQTCLLKTYSNSGGIED